jgi:riboflavin biosynthesis pyrimidine reductase
MGEVIAHLAMSLDGFIAGRTTAATSCSAFTRAGTWR